MSHKTKRQRLSYKEKYELIQEVKAGVPKDSTLIKYHISDRMYNRVVQSEPELLEKMKNHEFENKKSSKTTGNTCLEAAVITWYKQARDRGDPLSGPIIQEKALILNEKLGGSSTFKASTGWLEKFKKRYGIRNNPMKENESSNDPPSAAEFSRIFIEKFLSENLNLDNIYNADKSGISWQQLMACTPALRLEEERVSRQKESEDRVTALFCCNATGSHQIPLLTIGKLKTPQCLNNLIAEKSKDKRLKTLENLSVIYTNQSNASINEFIFLLWFKDEFIPRVLEHQRTSGITGKVVLLLDNASPHLSLDKLNAINENFEAVYLPPNVTALIQPMNQGVIATTKKMYKKNLLTSLLLEEKPEGAVKFIQCLNLRDCLAMLSLAWNSVHPSTLQKAWKSLLGDSFLPNSIPDSGNIQDPLFNIDANDNEPKFCPDLPTFPSEICRRVSQLLSGPDYSVEESRDFILKWLKNDDDNIDCGWEPLSDSDIVNIITSATCISETESETEESDSIFQDHDPLAVMPTEAFEGLMKFKTWFKPRPECGSTQLRQIEEFENVLAQNMPGALQNQYF